MAITRQRLKELEQKEKQLEEMKRMLGTKKMEKEEIDIIEDEPAEVHYSSGKVAKMEIPAKMLPPAKKKKWLGLKKAERNQAEEIADIKQTITEESPEILFQRWLQKRCKRGCHLCESCVQDIESIINA